MTEVTWMWFGRQAQINGDYRTAVTNAEADKIEGYTATGPSQMHATSLDGTLRNIRTGNGDTQGFATTYNRHSDGFSTFDYVSPATGEAAKAAITGFLSVKYELTLPDGTPWQGNGVLIQMHNGDMFFRPAKTEMENWEGVPEIKSVSILEADPLPPTTYVAPVSFSRGIFDVQVVCFASGTLILTPAGQVPIDDLEEGDLVQTKDNGPQPIRWHGSRSVSHAEILAYPKLKPIRISAGALGKDNPDTDLIVSRQHRILVRSAIAQRMFDTDELLVAAIQLTTMPGIHEIEPDEAVTYHHLLLDAHQIIYANGAEAESLYNGPQALKVMGKDAVEEITFLWPDILSEDANGPARPFARGKKLQQMLSRHIANGRPLT